MRNGRRLTAVGIFTGGLLLIGSAAPSLADVGTAGAQGTGIAAVSSGVAQPAAPAAQASATTAPTAAQVAAARTAAFATITADVLGAGAEVPQKCAALAQVEAFTTCVKGVKAAAVEAADASLKSKQATRVTPSASSITPSLLDGTTECDPEADENCTPSGNCIPRDYNGTDPGCGEAPVDICDALGTDPDVPDCEIVVPPCPNDANPSTPDCDLPVVCDPVDANPSTPECDLPPPPPTGDPTCTGTDYNGQLPGCGKKPTTDTPGPKPTGPKPGHGHGNGTGSGTPVGGGTGGGSGTGAGRGTGDGPGTGTGTALGVGGTRSEGLIPGATSEGSTPGTSACSGSVICSSIRGVDVTASTPAPAGVVDDGSGLPETGAPANTGGLLLAALGLLVTGGLLVRPRRRLALHRA